MNKFTKNPKVCFHMSINKSLFATCFSLKSSGIISRCQKYINLYYSLIYCSLIENINQFKIHRITKKDMTTMKFNTLNDFNWSELVSLEKRIWIILQFLFLAKKKSFFYYKNNDMWCETNIFGIRYELWKCQMSIYLKTKLFFISIYWANLYNSLKSMVWFIYFIFNFKFYFTSSSVIGIWVHL